jgi:uncharacterized membrane protein YeaQ/YmgE (transglycosylase-associated protein family)
MGILAWIVFGALLGSVAKYVLPGRAPGGVGATIWIGIAGALVGGLLATAVGLGTATHFEFRSMCTAVFGAIGFLFVFRLHADRSLA